MGTQKFFGAATRAVVLVFSVVLAGVIAGRAEAGSEASGVPAGLFRVSVNQVDDLKAVFATVRSSDRIAARARIAGTVAALTVDEGSEVRAGRVIAVIADEKIALKLRSIDARIVALKSRLDTARSELARNRKLKQRGVISQSRLDQFNTASVVAENDLKAARAERSVIARQAEEGKVLAPAGGRVLSVPVTVGSVLLPGEMIATIAANKYILRLELPERHARHIREGAPVVLAGRRAGEGGLGPGDPVGRARTGRLVKVYPELENGRVIADAEVSGLGSYFVGERVLVWISAGRRAAIVVPKSFVFRRFGLDYVRLKRADRKTIDIVVQPGRVARLDGAGGDAQGGIEILAGLRAGDEIVRP